MLKRLWGGGSDKVKSIRVPVHAYGKLPIYKDFISCGLTDPAAKEFRLWVDRGFSHRWSTDESCVSSEIPPHSFLVRMPESRGFAAGSLWGSSDEGGLRKFPFVLFLSFAKETDASDPVTAVEYLGEIERRASELRFVFGPGASLTSFYQTYRGTELDVLLRPREIVERELRSELSDFSVGDFAEALFGDASARAWPELLAAASNGVVGESPGAVRLPLSGRLPRAREIEFWLFWLDRLDPRRRRAVTGVLYPHGHNPGRAVFFFRDLKPEDFLLLHPTRSDLPAATVIEALSKVSEGAEITAAMRRKAVRQTPQHPAVVEPEPAPAEPPQGQPPEPRALPAPPPAAAPPPPPVLAAPEPPAAAPAPSSEASPFPEADIPPSTVGGARLSAIVALDPAASGSVPAGALAAPVPEAETPAAVAAPPAVSDEPAAPAPPLPAAPPAPAPPEPAPAAPVAAAAPISPPERPPRLPNPPGWDRPLPSLLGA